MKVRVRMDNGRKRVGHKETERVCIAAMTRSSPICPTPCPKECTHKVQPRQEVVLCGRAIRTHASFGVRYDYTPWAAHNTA